MLHSSKTQNSAVSLKSGASYHRYYQPSFFIRFFFIWPLFLQASKSLCLIMTWCVHLSVEPCYDLFLAPWHHEGVKRAAVSRNSLAFVAIPCMPPSLIRDLFSWAFCPSEMHKNMTGPMFMHCRFEDDVQRMDTVARIHYQASRKSTRAHKKQPCIEDWLHLLKFCSEAPLGISTYLIFIWDFSGTAWGVFQEVPVRHGGGCSLV